MCDLLKLMGKSDSVGERESEFLAATTNAATAPIAGVASYDAGVCGSRIVSSAQLLKSRIGVWL
jgi:hypothetical protein